jgi:hypothetical protein
MSKIPPQFWEDPEAFPSEGEAAEHRRHEDHEEHEHGDGCGHEAVPHGDHVDYVHDGHRHWWHRDHWDEH